MPTANWRTGCSIGLVGLAFSLPLTGNVLAEMSADAYTSTGKTSSPEDRIKESANIEGRRRLAEAQELARQQEEVHRQTVAANRLTMRPIGERLLDSRCTACHTLTVLANNSKSPLGWRLTVERMRWIHGANITTDEVRHVSAHLASTRSGGSSAADGVVVAGVTFVAIVMGALAWTVYRRSGR